MRQQLIQITVKKICYFIRKNCLLRNQLLSQVMSLLFKLLVGVNYEDFNVFIRFDGHFIPFKVLFNEIKSQLNFNFSFKFNSFEVLFNFIFEFCSHF